MTRKLLAISVLLLFAASLTLAQTPAPATATSPASESTPMNVGGDVLPPKLIATVEPKYPRPLFHKPKPSNVIVGLTVSTDGVPADIHIVKTGGAAFDKAAMKAVKQYRFQAATLHGEPVSVVLNVQVNFQIF